ncbi:MAG: STM3941 family protein [Sulfitobacter sp.]
MNKENPPKTWTNGMSVDTSVAITIPQSTAKIFRAFLISIVFIALGVWLVQGGAMDTRRGGLSVIAGWACLALFGLGGIALGYSLCFGTRKPILITPTGIHDTSKFASEIAWTEIKGISERKIKGTSLMCLDVDAQAIERAGPTRSFRHNITLDKAFGFDGIPIGVVIHETTFNAFWNVVRAYAVKHNPEIRIDR